MGVHGHLGRTLSLQHSVGSPLWVGSPGLWRSGRCRARRGGCRVPRGGRNNPVCVVGNPVGLERTGCEPLHPVKRPVLGSFGGPSHPV